MRTYIVVSNPKDWPLDLPGVTVLEARQYLAGGEYATGRARVFNLCRSYRYQTIGYYVSLLAAARGHRPFPNISTMQDMKSLTIVRYVSDELDDVIQHSLKPLQSKQFTLSVYFGHNIAKRYERLSSQLFNTFNAPLLRVAFTYTDKWEIQRVYPIGTKDLPPEHWDFFTEAARDFFSRPRFTVRKKRMARYDLAILYNPNEALGPSDEGAIKRFQKAALALDMEPEIISREDYGRLAEFDALFIRETTQVNHHTFRFSRRAAAEGLVVIDDPHSILTCTNKVYLAELLERHNVRTPHTVIVHRDNIDSVLATTGLPVVLKQPDSSFSQGVFKAENEEAYYEGAQRLMDKSELIIAQQYIPTAFDWRVGILDRKPLFVCRYYMAHKHWQIQKTEHTGRTVYGRVDTLAVEDAPEKVVKTALRAANLIGDGLYGVDLKETENGRCYVIEVNDNPSIDSNLEDAVLKDELYREIMQTFLNRIEHKKAVPKQ
jgi:glutathione synthase/RimK-type ligase-like ATP-grasp enzyme